MQSEKHIAILGERDALLCCSALAGMLAQAGNFIVDLIEQLPLDSRTLRQADLVILMTSHTALTNLAQRLRSESNTMILLIVDSETKLTLGHLANLDVDGAVSAGSSYAEVLTAIQTLLDRNLKYICPLLISKFAGPEVLGTWSCLSAKEMDVALALTNGKRNIEIASEMNISPKTVSSYKLRIYRKLGITNPAQLFKSRFDSNHPR